MVIRAESDLITPQTAAFGQRNDGSAPFEAAPLHAWSQSVDQPAVRAPSLMSLSVRQVRMLDLADLRNLDTLFRLNQPRAQLQSYSALRAGIRAAMPGMRGLRPAFVARSADRLVGFAQFRPEEPDERWNLLALGTAMGVYESDPVIEALLEHGVQSAGLRGVKRLFAKVPRTYPVGEAFRRQVWTPFATEVIYSADQARRPRHDVRVARPQAQADTWAVHQLYNAVVPKPVQDAEALTSHHWDLAPPYRGLGADSTTGWLVEDGHLVIGYARITASVRACLVEFVFNPERRDVLPVLIDQTLDVVHPRSGIRVYCAVRGYQAELATALEDRGFAPLLEQDLVIKYTTATVRLPVTEAVPFQLEVGEKIPQRVPTFLQGRSGDGAAN